MVYGLKLQQLREREGLTQKEAGKLINLDSGTYSHYEKEDLIIPTKHLNTYSNYFKVSFDYLFSFTTKKQYDNYKKDVDLKLSGKRLIEFRKSNKMTQTKLGDILNCSYGTIAGYEHGRYLIATPFLYTICKKYNISADYLLGKTDSPKYLKTKKETNIIQ